MYEPMTREQLLARGRCCHNGCKNCPYKESVKFMYYNLFLDDIRVPKDVKWIELPLVEWVIVRNFEEFVAYIKLHGVPARVSLDHDLGPEHYTYDWSGSNTCPNQLSGYDCVKWLVEYCQEHNHQFPEYTLHTMNDIGKQNMDSYIKSYKKVNETKTTKTKDTP